MTIQQPIYLWALLGLLVPLVIHLWSRKAGKTVKVGSIQWLIASENTRFSSIQFNEVGLYIIRSVLVLLAVLVLLDLSTIQDKNPGKLNKQWILAEETMLSNAIARPQIDSLIKKGNALHLLKAGMPLLATDEVQKIKVRASSAKPTGVNYWSFLQELDVRPDAPEKVIVFARNAQQHFAGKRPELGMKVEWQDLPLAHKQVFLVDALQLPNDSLQLSIGVSNENGTHLMKEKIKEQTNTKIKDLPSIIVRDHKVSFAEAPEMGIEIRQPKPQTVQLVYDKEFALDQQYLTAALQAVGEYNGVKVSVSAFRQYRDTLKTNWLMVLTKEENLVKYARVKTKKMLYQAKNTAQWISLDQVQQNTFFIHQRIDPQLNPKALESAFLENLTQALFANPKAGERIRQFDQRKISKSQVLPQIIVKKYTSAQSATETRSYQYMWWLALVAGVFAERLVANRHAKG